MNTKQIKGVNLLDQCEAFKFHSNVNGFLTYHGMSYDDEIIEVIIVGNDKCFAIINNFDIINMVKDSNVKVFANYAIM